MHEKGGDLVLASRARGWNWHMGDVFLGLPFNGSAGHRNERIITNILSLEIMSYEEGRGGDNGNQMACTQNTIRYKK